MTWSDGQLMSLQQVERMFDLLAGVKQIPTNVSCLTLRISLIISYKLRSTIFYFNLNCWSISWSTGGLV